MRCDTCRGTGKTSAKEAMILLWNGNDSRAKEFGAQQLPFPLKINAAITFLWDYLQQSEYPNQPDHDGSNGRGFLITTGDYWGHIEGLSYSIVMVAPEWQMYGK